MTQLKPIDKMAAAPLGQPDRSRIEVKNLNFWYGKKHALKDVSFDLNQSEILAFIGPSGCGKSTALKCLNRMYEDIPDARAEGEIILDGQNILDRHIDLPSLRRKFGWVAQKPNPFAKSIFENVAYGPRIHGLVVGEKALHDHVEHVLRRAMLWDDVKDDLHRKSGNDLSGGQQQRLCIARALATEAKILLMDEPTGSIDPIATAKIEDLMAQLKDQCSIIVITHSMMEARRISDRVAYFHLGELREIGETQHMFGNATDPDARRFMAGEFG